jgi:hypothetical protein
MEASQYLMIDYPLPLNILVSYVIFAFSGVEALNVTTPQQLDAHSTNPHLARPRVSEGYVGSTKHTKYRLSLVKIIPLCHS